MYYTSNDCNYFGVDVDDYIFNDYEFFDEDYGGYDYYDYDYDHYGYYYDDDYYDVLYYKKPFNYFKRLVSHKNNIVHWIDNVSHNHEITLFVNNHRVCIC